MAYTIQCSQTLSPEGAAVRTKVFVEEQGFQNEFDRWDENGCAWHVLVRDGETPIAAGRMYSEAEGEYTLGRIAVIPAYRGKHIGKLLVSALEKQEKTCGASRFSLSAQCDKSGFYQKLGYALTEDCHMDEFCPHVTMVKSLIE
ncbi:GNAT family N-acetyltransferase [Ruminococcus sp.]